MDKRGIKKLQAYRKKFTYQLSNQECTPTKLFKKMQAKNKSPFILKKDIT